ncbi:MULTISPECIES: hypothetical protein [unclassified Mesorhizobium]|uniref:hypothetical protein n=1 Tax=unclassified Mesorhizobium TaxID=325217 RepID=UPI0015E3B58F|nr:MULTISPECIES: hypothetical protein [unclassified Mesorhizobium]
MATRLTVIPVGETFEFGSAQRSLRLRDSFDGQAYARRLPGNAGLWRDRFDGCDDAARDKALAASFSPANRKIASPSATCLPPYIVFRAAKANVVAPGLAILALIANAMLVDCSADTLD